MLHHLYYGVIVLQLQLRDYPLPLILGAEVTAVGRMMFAEQEAEERGTCVHAFYAAVSYIAIIYLNWYRTAPLLRPPLLRPTFRKKRGGA